MAIQFESDPPEGCAHHARARIVDLQGVGATQVHRDGRWRVDHELTGRSPDVGVNRSPVQSDPLQPRTHAQQAQACARVHLDFAGIVLLKADPRLTVRLGIGQMRGAPCTSETPQPARVVGVGFAL